MIPQALTTYANVIATQAMSDSQPRIERMIGAISLAVQNELSRSFGYFAAPTSAPERYKGTGGFNLFLRRWPLVSVEEVKIQLSVITDYETDPEFLAQGRLWRDLGWPRESRPFADLTHDANPSNLKDSITVAYTAGYILPQYDGVTDAAHNPAGAAANLPPDIEEAVIDSVTYNLLHKPVSGLKAERTAGGWAQDWDTSAPVVLTQAAMRWLEPYRGRWFGVQ